MIMGGVCFAPLGLVFGVGGLVLRGDLDAGEVNIRLLLVEVSGVCGVFDFERDLLGVV